MDFAVDENLLLEAKDKCETTATEIEDYINQIYSKIIGLGDSWSGDSYDSFLEACEKYKEPLNQLVSILRAFAALLDEVNAPREELENAIKSAINS